MDHLLLFQVHFQRAESEAEQLGYKLFLGYGVMASQVVLNLRHYKTLASELAVLSIFKCAIHWY